MYAKNGGLSRKLKLLHFLFGFYSTFFFYYLKNNRTQSITPQRRRGKKTSQ